MVAWARENGAVFTAKLSMPTREDQENMRDDPVETPTVGLHTKPLEDNTEGCGRESDPFDIPEAEKGLVGMASEKGG